LWLKRKQRDDGSWGSWQDARNTFKVGLAALPALTMLECGVPSDDPVVSKAVQYVRQAVPELSRTYDLSMSVLLLDRLGEEEDRPRIRTMALRLIAGQKPSGGWNYGCPVLAPEDERELLELLERTRPRSVQELVALKAGAPGRVANRPNPDAGRAARGPDGLNSRVPPAPKNGGAGLTDRGSRPPDAGAVGKLPAALRGIPALNPPAQAEAMPPGDDTDNSNTQFAALALWAAGRHDVPMERTLTLLDRRFRVSQTPGGRWGYYFHSRSDNDEYVTTRSAMTGSGLLGLAVAHGLTTSGTMDGTRPPPAEDPAIERGLKALGQLVGDAKPPSKGIGRRAPPPKGINFYLLWTLERVGVLYNLTTIGGKDWYAWGTDVLLRAQGQDGSWRNGDYPGAATTHDTCFALLFLKRANLTQDLSQRLEFVIEVKERGDREGRRAGN
jgi:hypothetical protein